MRDDEHDVVVKPCVNAWSWNRQSADSDHTDMMVGVDAVDTSDVTSNADLHEDVLQLGQFTTRGRVGWSVPCKLEAVHISEHDTEHYSLHHDLRNAFNPPCRQLYQSEQPESGQALLQSHGQHTLQEQASTVDPSKCVTSISNSQFNHCAVSRSCPFDQLCGPGPFSRLFSSDAGRSLGAGCGHEPAQCFPGARSPRGATAANRAAVDGQASGTASRVGHPGRRRVSRAALGRPPARSK